MGLVFFPAKPRYSAIASAGQEWEKPLNAGQFLERPRASARQVADQAAMARRVPQISISAQVAGKRWASAAVSSGSGQLAKF